MCNQCPVNMRKRRGCTAPTDAPVRLDMEIGHDGVAAHRYVFDLCPVNFVDAEHRTTLALYGLWRQGKMLESGGIADQPAKYIDIMMMLDGWWNQAEAAAIERAGQKRGK